MHLKYTFQILIIIILLKFNQNLISLAGDIKQ